MNWPPKDPDEILDYDIDWTSRLYSKAELASVAAGETVIPADSISTSTFTLPLGIVANSTSNTTTTTKVWISGGTEGQSYLVENRIVTAGGRTMDQTVKLRIKSK
ncbi:MAG: hypothetical protein ABFD89_18410 [Bryobacteraceae bacterium]